jgi:DNA invertase Pin-like site-specific DNA recombinase
MRAIWRFQLLTGFDYLRFRAVFKVYRKPKRRRPNGRVRTGTHSASNLGGETVDTKSATGKLILTIFAGFAQFEREMMLERQREGIAKAKAENRYLGRRPSARLKADEAVKLFREGRTVTQIAAALTIGRGSVYRALEAAEMGRNESGVYSKGSSDNS